MKSGLYSTVSRLYLTVFFLKVSDIMYIFPKEKKRVHNWQSNVISNFIYFYYKHLQPSLINGMFVIFRKLKVRSCKLYNNKYTVALKQITNTEIFAFIAVLFFKLLSRKFLFLNRKDNRNC